MSVASRYQTFENLVNAAKAEGYPLHIFVPFNGKIADITHADQWVNHTLNIKTALAENRTVIAILISANRVSGTGALVPYSNSGATVSGYSSSYASAPTIVTIKNNTLTYALSAANDDFDLYCFGYVVEL